MTDNPRQNVTFTSNGGQAHGYLATPAGGTGPGVIVIQEWWGLTDHIADVADRLAAEGFVALAPDLFGGSVAHDADEAGRLMTELPVDRAAQDLAGAVDYLLAHDGVTGEKVGAVGFCMGGGFVLMLAAQQGDKIRAAVPFYGVGPAVPSTYTGLTAAVQGHYGEKDDFYPVEQAKAQEQQIAQGVRRAGGVLLLPGRARVPQRRERARHLRRGQRHARLEPHRRVPAGLAVSAHSARYALAAAGFTSVLQGASPGSWTAPSPCEEWTAHDVAQHVIETHRRILTRLTGGDPTPPDSGDDLGAAWAVESAAVQAALDDERAATEVQGMGGEQRFDELVGTLLVADTVLHTWDLARATGQDDHLDPELVTATHAFLAPNDDALRRPGGFGPKTEPPPGADAQTALLCFVGRQP